MPAFQCVNRNMIVNNIDSKPLFLFHSNYWIRKGKVFFSFKVHFVVQKKQRYLSQIHVFFDKISLTKIKTRKSFKKGSEKSQICQGKDFYLRRYFLCDEMHLKTNNRIIYKKFLFFEIIFQQASGSWRGLLHPSQTDLSMLVFWIFSIDVKLWFDDAQFLLSCERKTLFNELVFSCL